MIYSYAELKGKIKVGDRVKAAVGFDNQCDNLLNGQEATITDIGISQFYIDGCSHRYDAQYSLELFGQEVTLDNLRKGDVIERNGSSRVVLATIEDLVFLSEVSDHDVASEYFLVQELKSAGWKPVQTEAVVKQMTLADVEKLVGSKVKIIS
jgi:hypothetical protein